jgi:hypothetical protein
MSQQDYASIDRRDTRSGIQESGSDRRLLEP